MLTRQRYLLGAIALLAVLCIRWTTATTASPLPPLRLPTAIIPLKYYLHLTNHIHRDILEYSGNVTIDLLVREPTNEIVLHAKQLRDFVLTLSEIRTDRHYENIQYSYENGSDFLRIFSPHEALSLQVGEQYRLEVLFNGEIRSSNFGIYKTSYKDENNKTIPIATTQFEPTSARLAFPCFDEPALKARFSISITHGSNYSCLSNMPTDGVPVASPDGTMKTTSFAETPLMSTYLVAFVVSNYNYISERAYDIEHRVFFPPNSKDNGYRALKNSIKAVTAMEDYLGIKYPLPKLDHIRVDKTYGSAMENWGLITYNKKNFLTNSDGSTSQANLKLTVVQNHEIAHQWFGNLVSPKWWTYAWLNEGFATYFAYIATELVHPDWRVPEYFVNDVELVYSWPISRPMTNYVETEADIRSAFDVVIYQKAACMVKMFHHAIGHKTFIKGLSLYLTKFQYSAADEDDLFGALQEAIDDDGGQFFHEDQAIARVMHTWTHNHAIPTVTVIRNYEEETLTIRQKSTHKHQEELWWIPLNFAHASNPNFTKTSVDYIMPPEHEVTVSLKELKLHLSQDDWLIVNKQQTGLYHVVYDERNLQLIAEALQAHHPQIHMLNRALLFRDINAVLDKDIPINRVFDILRYLKEEEELLSWNKAADLILDLGSNLYGSKSFDEFTEFIRDIIGPIFNKVHQLPKSELSVIDVLARAKIIDVACNVDLIECLNYTKALAHEYFFHEVEIDNERRDITLCHGIKHAKFEDFRRLVDKLVSSNPNTAHYDDIIYSIRCVESAENLKYFLELIFGDNSTSGIMSDTESMQFLAFIYVSNYFSRPILLEFMRDNYKAMCKHSSMVTVTLDRISNYVSEDDGQKEEFIELLGQIKEISQDAAKIEDHKIGSRIRKREHFRRKHEDDIYAWLKNYEKEKTAKSAASQSKPSFATARYIVAAGFLSNLIGFV